MNCNENIIRKQKLFDHVINTTCTTLDIVRSPEDPLLTSLDLFIYNNLGINVNVRQSKYKVLNDIEVLFEKRTKKITENNLDKLENLLYGLDRNNDNDIISIKQFIFVNYNVRIDESHLCPSVDTHAIIDYIITKL